MQAEIDKIRAILLEHRHGHQWWIDFLIAHPKATEKERAEALGGHTIEESIKIQKAAVKRYNKLLRTLIKIEKALDDKG